MHSAERSVVRTIANPDSDLAAIESVVMQYNQATVDRATEVLEGLLHPEARQFVTGPRSMVIDTSTFLQLLEDGAIGGVEREVIIHEIEVDGPMASAHVTFESDAAHFRNYFSLLKIDDVWQIVSVVVEMKPQG